MKYLLHIPLEDTVRWLNMRNVKGIFLKDGLSMESLSPHNLTLFLVPTS